MQSEVMTGPVSPQRWEQRLPTPRPLMPAPRALGVALLLGTLVWGCGPQDAAEEGDLETTAQAVTTLPLRINSGGGGVTDPVQGVTWAEDQGFTGGAIVSTAQPIAGTTLDELYQTSRVGMEGYHLAVPGSGPFRVRLYMAEPTATSAGQRVFDVEAEGVTLVHNLDLYARVGALRAHVVDLEVTVMDGTLDLTFPAYQGESLVSAIEVRASAWKFMGTARSALPPQTFPSLPVLAMDSSTGNPWLAWEENKLIWVQRWNGTAWVAAGTGFRALPAGYSISDVSLAVSSAGVPTVAWVESEPVGYGAVSRTFVRRWNGTDWAPLGVPVGPKPDGGGSARVSLAVDASGVPTLAIGGWDGVAPAAEIYVFRWDGTQWVKVGNSLSALPGDTGSASPALVLDAAGAPIVAWQENVWSPYHTSTIRVARWTGAAWEMIGTLTTDPGGQGSAETPELALDSAGALTVAWREYGEVQVARQLGTSWSLLGQGPRAPIGWQYEKVHAISLALGPDGYPAVAWAEYYWGSTNYFMQRWDGTAWKTWAGTGASGPVAASMILKGEISLALTPQGLPVLATPERRGDEEFIQVRRIR